MLEYERQMQQQGYTAIAGMDEAGRGPLAGPVVVACVVMPLDNIIEGIDDSKKLTAKKRQLLYDKIVNVAREVTVSVVSPQTIDEINILNATKRGMQDCIARLNLADCVLIDAVKLEAKLPCMSIIHGDALSYNIAAASIVAKVTRDKMMLEYAKQYPQYGFEKHKGYGTALHIERLRQFGKCDIHRDSFIKKFI